jgi:hypothetical protein
MGLFLKFIDASNDYVLLAGGEKIENLSFMLYFIIKLIIKSLAFQIKLCPFFGYPFRFYS